MRTCIVAPLVLAAACAGVNAQKLEIVCDGLRKPVDFVADPASDARFYIVEQGGLVRIVEDGKLLPDPFFEVNRSDFLDKGWEQGLLGMAFDADYKTNGFFYVNYTDAKGDTHIARFKATDAHHADTSSEQLVLFIDQPYSNHNGGCVRVGPDGFLYVGTGDGGAANDPHGAGQRLDTLLAKMLRVDPSKDDFPDDDRRNYAIPKDNPFVGREGALPEIWACGMRNPWKHEFDSIGRMWIGDVGQNRFEEVHLQPAGSKGGENYGWNVLEGNHVFVKGNRPPAPDSMSIEEQREKGFEPAVWEYPQRSTGGVGSVTGGFFYENDTIPALKDRYICADFMSGDVWAFKLKDGRADDVVSLTSNFAPAFSENGPQLAISSFGRDNSGELYVLDHKNGRLLKIVP